MTGAPRVRAVLSTVTGLACLALAVVPTVAGSALAQAEKGSGLGSFALAANAPVVQTRFDDGNRCAGGPSSTAGCEGVVPETVSTLSQGPVGFALSSVVWPGTLAGNLGSTLILAGNGQVPEGARVLNSPVRAEARTGQEPSKVRNAESAPGTVMTASAVADEVTATAEVAQSSAVGVGTFGNSTSRSRTAVTGASSAVAEATSEVTDVVLAGVVRIGAVRSTAKATTDGATGKAEGGTVASGITIAGVPVTIDDEGIHVAGQGGPFNATLSDAVNAAVRQAGMTVALSRPVTTTDRGNVTYSAGSLVFDFAPSPEGRFTVVLGGATVDVAAEPALDLGIVDLPTSDLPAPGVEPLAGNPAGDVPGGEVAVAQPPAPDATVPTSPEVAAAPAGGAVAEPVLAPRRFALPTGLSPAAVALGLAGAGLLFAGLRRLPDRLLEEAPSTACTLEGTS